MKPKTYFIDIDGCIFIHRGEGASYQWLLKPPELCYGVVQQLDILERRGDMIVLVTARPETLRERLEYELQLLGVIYHRLVMGVTSGVRVLVNDAKPENEDTAIGITIPRNEGLRRIQ